jgi:tetratricopeptide (TPR) repeat protein
MATCRPARWALSVLLSAFACPPAALAFSNVALGEVVPSPELPALGGGRHALLSSGALANVFVFFRPQQDHSLDALKAVASCEKEFSGKPVHFVAVVSSSWSPEEVRRMVVEAGIQMPVLVDEDDALYGRLGVRLHPVIGVANERFELLAYEPFRKINYCDRMRAKIRFALHEIDRSEMERAEAPARALFPNEMKGAIANRHVRMGEGFLRMKQYDKAAAEARHVLATEPLHVTAHLLLGDALAAQGKCAEARKEYDSAQKLDPKLEQAVSGRRGACAQK